VPALFERIERPEPAATLAAAIGREPSSAHHVPELADLDTRLTRRLGAKRARELAEAGGALDLNDAAVFAQQQIEIAHRSPIPSGRHVRPGGLSRREVEVLRLVADGRTSREIAAQLFISARTAEHHVQHVYTKIGVANRAAATRWAVEHDVVDTKEGIR
jgi:DNA-binding CsgD family transcriptional regulator